jgi:hypothetical protein
VSRGLRLGMIFRKVYGDLRVTPHPTDQLNVLLILRPPPTWVSEWSN